MWCGTSPAGGNARPGGYGSSEGERPRQEPAHGAEQPELERKRGHQQIHARIDDLERLAGVAALGDGDGLQHRRRDEAADAVHGVRGKADKPGRRQKAGDPRRVRAVRPGQVNVARATHEGLAPACSPGSCPRGASRHRMMRWRCTVRRQPAKTACASAEGERLLVQRPADDDAHDLVRVQLLQPAQVVQQRDAAGEDDLELGDLGEIGEAGQVRTAEHAVAGRVGVDDALYPVFGQHLDETDGAHLRTLLPAVRGDHAVRAVEADDEPVAEPVDRVVEQVERRDRGGAHDDPVHADAGHEREALRRADAAAVLDRDLERLDDVLDDGEVGELTAARRVEVDDVQSLGALVLPVARQFHGVVAEHRDVVEVAAPQTHRLACLDIDGGEHDHDVPASR